MNNKFKIRDLNKNDMPACLKIVKEALTEWDVEKCKNDFNEPYDVYRFVIEEIEQKNIVGFMGYYSPQPRDIFKTTYDAFLFLHVKNSVCLDWGAILPEYQNLKLGQAIVEHCEKHAKNKGKEYVATWTIVPNFFQKCGYSKAEGYNEEDDESYGAVLMIKKIK